MESSSKPIAPLDKINLRLKAVSLAKSAGRTTVETDVVFICGIGTAGLTPFEQMLVGKPAGQTFTMAVEPGSDHLLFGHLQCMLHQALDMAPPFELHITISSAATPQGREVVKAMAQMAEGCGGGCDCGCGC